MTDTMARDFNIDESKQILKSYLEKNDLKNRLKLEKNRGKDSVAIEKQILDIIRNNKEINGLLNEISAKMVKPIHDVTKPYLHVDVVGGRAFVDFLETPSRSSDTLTCSLNFEGRRVHTKPKPCECEPKFNETFFFELQTGNAEEILEKSKPIQVTMIRTGSDGKRCLISTVLFDYVQVLSMDDGKAAVSLKLHGIGHENRSVPVGILDLRIRIGPILDKKLSKEVVTSRLKFRDGQRAERERVFLQYARVWWAEYLDIRPSHANRTVKIFARDVGGAGDRRMVSWFVLPLYCDRLIETAGQALRFVSLIPNESRIAEIGGGARNEAWKAPAVLLELADLDHEDHSILLCCILLGFGLDAYVTFGATVNADIFSWVTTINSGGEVTFWDGVTGNRYSRTATHPFQTVDCLFNHHSFYGNCQNSNLILASSFDLSDQTLWKPMSSDRLKAVASDDQMSVALRPGTLDPIRTCTDLENELKDLMIQYRKDLNLSTRFSEKLSRILGPGLAGYELECQTGQALGTDEFIDAVKHSVCEGHTFKGFPVNAKHANGRRIFGESLTSNVFKDIINCRGDQLNFAIYVKVYVLPEDVLSVWAMFAVSYLSIS